MNSIAKLNDRFRRTLEGGEVVLSVGVQNLPELTKTEILFRVATHTDFNAKSDPTREHRFLEFDSEGTRYVAIITRYVENHAGGPHHPSDLKTKCAMLIMLAAEYY